MEVQAFRALHSHLDMLWMKAMAYTGCICLGWRVSRKNQETRHVEFCLQTIRVYGGNSTQETELDELPHGYSDVGRQPSDPT